MITVLIRILFKLFLIGKLLILGCASFIIRIAQEPLPRVTSVFLRRLENGLLFLMRTMFGLLEGYRSVGKWRKDIQRRNGLAQILFTGMKMELLMPKDFFKLGR